MKEMDCLKFNKCRQFKKKANKERFRINQSLSKTLDHTKSATENSQLEKVKTSLEEGATFISERQKHTFLANKSGYRWAKVLEYKLLCQANHGLFPHLCLVFRFDLNLGHILRVVNLATGVYPVKQLPSKIHQQKDQRTATNQVQFFPLLALKSAVCLCNLNWTVLLTWILALLLVLILSCQIPSKIQTLLQLI